MFTIGRLFDGIGRLLRFVGGFACAAGVIFLVLCPPSVASALGGWFLAVGAVSWLFGQIPSYVGTRILDAVPYRPMSAINANDLDMDAVLSRSSDHSSDRSGIFGGDRHKDALTWQAMRNSQDRGF
jgi:hypothetical protein